MLIQIKRKKRGNKELNLSVKIRLKKMGSNKRPFYRVVVMDSRKSRNSIAIEELGYYHPLMKENQIKVDKDKIKEWVAKGAILTDVVKQIVKKSV